MPTFAFPTSPEWLTPRLQCRWNAPLPIVLLQFHSFGNMLNARVLSTPDRSTSELLRTL
jgi:hypothetical protein